MTINLEQIIPEQEIVLESMGVNIASGNSKRLKGILDESLQLFTSLANPVSLVTKIGHAEFGEIYDGEGNNDENKDLHICLAYFFSSLLLRVCLYKPSFCVPFHLSIKRTYS